jgi:hypothetical protein
MLFYPSIEIISVVVCWSPWRAVFAQPGRLPWSKPPQTSSREPVPPASGCVAPSWPWVKLSKVSYTGPPETASSLPLGACRSYGGVRRPPQEGTALGCWWRLRMPRLVWRHRRCGQHFILGDDGSSGFQGDLHGWEVSELDQAEHLSLDGTGWSGARRELLIRTAPHWRTPCIMLCWLLNGEEHCATEMEGEPCPTRRAKLFREKIHTQEFSAPG